MPDTIPTPTDAPVTGTGIAPSVQEFKLNHPKNYLAVPLADAADAGSEFLIREFAVNLPDRARRGAEEVGLITTDGDTTELGEAVVITGTRVHGSPRAALEAFGELHGSPKRFVDVFPKWRGIAKRIAFRYEATSQLVTFLREQGDLRLDALAWLLWKHDPALAESVFLHPGVTEMQAVTAETRPRRSLFTDPSMYRSECTFQYKAFLYHCGIVESRGDYTSRLHPSSDVWSLDPSFK